MPNLPLKIKNQICLKGIIDFDILQESILRKISPYLNTGHLENDEEGIDLEQFKGVLENYLSKNLSDKQKNTAALSEIISNFLLYRFYKKINKVKYLGNKPISKKGNLSPDKAYFCENHDELLKLLDSSDIEFIGKNIIIKPNLVSKRNYPETTNKLLLQSIVKYVRNKGAKSVRMIEGPSIFYSDDFLNNMHLPCEFINSLDSDKIACMDGIEGLDTLFFDGNILDGDMLLNISNLKEHTNAGYSASRKNLMGILPGFERLRFHKDLDINKAIDAMYDSLSSILPILNIVDGRSVLRKAQMRNFGGVRGKGKGIYFGLDAHSVDETAIKDNF